MHLFEKRGLERAPLKRTFRVEGGLSRACASTSVSCHLCDVLQTSSSKDFCGAPFCAGMKVVWCELLLLVPAVAQKLAPFDRASASSLACIKLRRLVRSWQSPSLRMPLLLERLHTSHSDTFPIPAEDKHEGFSCL